MFREPGLLPQDMSMDLPEVCSVCRINLDLLRILVVIQEPARRQVVRLRVALSVLFSETQSPALVRADRSASLLTP